MISTSKKITKKVEEILKESDNLDWDERDKIIEKELGADYFFCTYDEPADKTFVKGVELGQLAQQKKLPLYQSSACGGELLLLFLGDEKTILNKLNDAMQYTLLKINEKKALDVKEMEKQIKEHQNKIASLKEKVRVGKLTAYQ
jgi:hypothetical protein